MATKEDIRRYGFSLGFDVVRFAPATTSHDTQQRLRNFVGQGLHGDMAWMSETLDRRADPKVLWPDAKSAVVVGLNYAPGSDPRKNLDQSDRGVISVYAQNKDYHDVLKKKLRQFAQWLHATLHSEVKLFVDTAPVMEKPLAQSAGVGWQGKHTNVVSREFGSWLFLGEVLTAAEIEPDEPEQDHCGQCQRCLDVCPTSAFIDAYQIDARLCISYLTIEHKGHIPRELRGLMGNRIYGCDDCLAVCPWNKFAHATTDSAFFPRAELMSPRLRDLAALDDATFRQIFSGSPIKRIGRTRFVRNVLIAIGNSGDSALLESARALLADESAVVRVAAIWAFKRLASEYHSDQARTISLEREADPDARAEWLA